MSALCQKRTLAFLIDHLVSKREAKKAERIQAANPAPVVP
jgi:hypothetical protein